MKNKTNKINPEQTDENDSEHIVDPIDDPDDEVTPIDEPHHTDIDPIEDPNGDINPVDDPKNDKGFKRDRSDKRGDAP